MYMKRVSTNMFSMTPFICSWLEKGVFSGRFVSHVVEPCVPAGFNFGAEEGGNVSEIKTNFVVFLWKIREMVVAYAS